MVTHLDWSSVRAGAVGLLDGWVVGLWDGDGLGLGVGHGRLGVRDLWGHESNLGGDVGDRLAVVVGVGAAVSLGLGW